MVRCAKPRRMFFPDWRARFPETSLPQYAERRRSTFPYQDGRCCERIYQAILALDAPRDDDNVIELAQHKAAPVPEKKRAKIVSVAEKR